MNKDTLNKEQRFKALYKKYYAPFCIYAKRFLQDLITREDIINEAFTDLWIKANNIIFEENKSVSYLKTTIHNKCLNYLKHQNCENEYTEQYKYRTPIYAESPESIYTLDEMYKLLSEAIEKLPPNCRRVYIESFLENKKQADIAQELNISVKTVERYRTEVIERLRKELKDYLPLLALLTIIITK